MRREVDWPARYATLCGTAEGRSQKSMASEGMFSRQEAAK